MPFIARKESNRRPPHMHTEVSATGQNTSFLMPPVRDFRFRSKGGCGKICSPSRARNSFMGGCIKVCSRPPVLSGNKQSARPAYCGLGGILYTWNLSFKGGQRGRAHCPLRTRYFGDGGGAKYTRIRLGEVLRGCSGCGNRTLRSGLRISQRINLFRGASTLFTARSN